MAKSNVIKFNNATPNVRINPSKLEYYSIVERGRVEKRTCIELMFHSGYIEIYFDTIEEAKRALEAIDQEAKLDASFVLED